MMSFCGCAAESTKGSFKMSTKVGLGPELDGLDKTENTKKPPSIQPRLR